MAMARRTATTIRNNPSPLLPIRTKKAESPRSLPFFISLPPCRAADTFFESLLLPEGNKKRTAQKCHRPLSLYLCLLSLFHSPSELGLALALHKRAILIRSLIPKILLFVFVLCRKSVNLHAKNASVPFSKSIFRVNNCGTLRFTQCLAIYKRLRIFL